MSGCHPPYIRGNLAISNYCHTDNPNPAYFCKCPCHKKSKSNENNKQCWCKCNKNTQIIQVTTNGEPINMEDDVLRRTINDSNETWSYYGVINDERPIRSLADDLIIDRERQMIEGLKEIEERIKRHVTDCKREIIREFREIKTKRQLDKKGNENGKTETIVTTDDSSNSECN
jgi:hypothetical protein